MEYNGNPESVGYKIKYSRSDGHGKTLSHTVQDRVEREYTIEDLEEWTEYRVQVQAFNAIGSGPWSQAVVGRTRESGTTHCSSSSGAIQEQTMLRPFLQTAYAVSLCAHPMADHPARSLGPPVVALPCDSPSSWEVCGITRQYWPSCPTLSFNPQPPTEESQNILETRPISPKEPRKGSSLLECEP